VASQVDQIVERVERLLVRYEELQRTNALLVQQVEVLTQERDSLKSRLSAARSRVDALLERLPDLNTAPRMKAARSADHGPELPARLPRRRRRRLLEAVEKVDTAMCKIRDAGKVKARDRIAVLAALNLAFDIADRRRTRCAMPPRRRSRRPPREATTTRGSPR
jgi:cell division protein ZapB